MPGAAAAGEGFTLTEVTFVAAYDLGRGAAFDAAGASREAFEGWCGGEVMVRAYNQMPDTWSTVVDPDAGC